MFLNSIRMIKLLSARWLGWSGSWRLWARGQRL